MAEPANRKPAARRFWEDRDKFQTQAKLLVFRMIKAASDRVLATLRRLQAKPGLPAVRGLLEERNPLVTREADTRRVAITFMKGDESV
jgi:hypothetical protein